MMHFERLINLNKYCDVCGSRGVVARLVLNGVKSIGLNSKVNLCKKCLDSHAFEVNKAVKGE